jgi:ubiquinone/menaquinone biosynthesis C-methylase UbiE
MTTTSNTQTTTRDPWSIISRLDDATVASLAERLEIRAADPQQRHLWAEFLARAAFPEGARVLEVGCGTGVITRMIAALPGVAAVVGVDPAAELVARARREASHLTFDIGDGESLPYDDQSFDAVVFATTLCHVPDPRRALAEARRVTRPGGLLLIYEGDYNTATVGLSAHDPLQTCVEAGVSRMVNDPWIVRGLRPMVDAAGFANGELRSHGYVEVSATYMTTLVTAGTAAMAERGVITQPLADALVAEARSRADADRFFGHIAYASLVTTRPEDGAVDVQSGAE